MEKSTSSKRAGPSSAATRGREQPAPRPGPGSRFSSFCKKISTMSRQATEPRGTSNKAGRESSSWLPLDLKARYCVEVYGYRDAGMDVDTPFGRHRDSVEMLRPTGVMEAVLERLAREEQEQEREECWGTVSLSGSIQS